MKDLTPHKAYGRAVLYGFLMTAAFFGPFLIQSAPFALIFDSISFICGYAMVRETWHARPKALLIIWLLAYSLFTSFLGFILGYANVGLWSESRAAAIQITWIHQIFFLFGGGFLLCCTLALTVRAFLTRDTTRRIQRPFPRDLT